MTPVRWTTPAVGDLTRICDHTRKQFSGPQARRAALAIYEAAESLATFPSQGRPGRNATRELVLQGLPFLIIYRVRDDAVEIIRILHGSQKRP